MTSIQSQAAAPSSQADTPRVEQSSPTRGDFEITFEDSGTKFSALYAAKTWLEARGFSVGHLQAGAPIGIMLGCFDVQKWRNLDAEDRADLHGFISSPTLRYRNGPVTVYIRRDAPHDVIEAFNQEEARNTEGATGSDHEHQVDRQARLHAEGPAT